MRNNLKHGVIAKRPRNHYAIPLRTAEEEKNALEIVQDLLCYPVLYKADSELFPKYLVVPNVPVEEMGEGYLFRVYNESAYQKVEIDQSFLSQVNTYEHPFAEVSPTTAERSHQRILTHFVMPSFDDDTNPLLKAGKCTSLKEINKQIQNQRKVAGDCHADPEVKYEMSEDTFQELMGTLTFHGIRTESWKNLITPVVA